MADVPTLNIVVLGASFSGISVVHHLVKHSFPQLTESGKFKYRITLVSPSTHLYWNISAPRALVSSTLVPHEDSFQPIAKGLHPYGDDILEYINGSAVALDTVASNVTIIRLSSGEHESQSAQPSGLADTTGASPTAWGNYTVEEDQAFKIHYHALVIATGSTAHSPLLSLRGPHTNTLNTLDTFHKKLPTADTVVIAGGGPSGVETAGQIAYWYNQPEGPNMKPKMPFKASSILSRLKPTRTSRFGTPHKKNVILLAGASSLLPKLHPSLGAKALKQLTSIGVRVIFDTRVTGASVASNTGKTTLKLSNDTVMLCDLYVPCTGVTPNTQFLPKDSPILRNGYIATTPTPSTMRVDLPEDMMPADGPDNPYPKGEKAVSDGLPPSARVYAIGDCAAYSRNCILDIYAAIPVLMNNITNDLLAAQLYIENPYGGNEERIAELAEQDMELIMDERDSQVCPIGLRRPGGVGAVFGYRLPSLAVYLAKGKHYKIDAAPKTVGLGLSPY